MEYDKIYTGDTEEEVWRQLDIDGNAFEYHVLIRQSGKEISLDIEDDLGGGFDGGFATTSFSSALSNTDFRFSAHDKDFIDEVGKFLGMQDVEIGFPELDEHLIIKTNDEARVKTLFGQSPVIAVFTTLTDFDFGIHLHSVEHRDSKQAFLELNIRDAVTDSKALRELYHAFCVVMDILEPSQAV